MPMQGTWLRRAALAALAAASLSLPMLSVASADQPAQQTQASTTHPKKQAVKPQSRQPGVAPQPLFGSADSWVAKRCAWPYQNQFPPCMSTWPAGDPNYHGSRPGPTFDAPF